MPRSRRGDACAASQKILDGIRLAPLPSVLSPEMTAAWKCIVLKAHTDFMLTYLCLHSPNILILEPQIFKVFFLFITAIWEPNAWMLTDSDAYTFEVPVK